MFGFGHNRIYFDYASAPPVLKEAEKAMLEVSHLKGNPGAIHKEGVEAKAALEKAREDIARILGVRSRELLFTSGLTESNNLAIVGYAHHLERVRRTLKDTHWLVSAIEHSSVLACFAEVERLGGDVTYIETDARGVILPDAVAAKLRKETVFVSVGWANNEIGVVQPLRDIAAVLRIHEKEHGTDVIFHTDAGQAPLYLPTSVHSLAVDLMSIGSNKLYGPHGVGALHLSNRTQLAPVLFGGKQERGLRAGTENVALAAGFAAAFSIVAKERGFESKRLGAIRDTFAEELLRGIPGLVVNGDVKLALPHMLNVSIPDISGEYVTLALDHAGIAVSTKSACREGEESVSHVVAALGGDTWRAKNTLRFSLGRETREDGARRAGEVLVRILKKGKS
ncbi:cysteine desulfurase [Candidatus Kaiserbacteria bacterium]|nr:cysteine desulfurase [Candidatus Kaiserbacteria bacterium]